MSKMLEAETAGSSQGQLRLTYRPRAGFREGPVLPSQPRLAPLSSLDGVADTGILTCPQADPLRSGAPTSRLCAEAACQPGE